MMFAKGDEFIKDFALWIKENYRMLQKRSYEVTKVIDSAVGLLIIPQQNQYDKIVDSIVAEDLIDEQNEGRTVLSRMLQPTWVQYLSGHVLRNRWVIRCC